MTVKRAGQRRASVDATGLVPFLLEQVGAPHVRKNATR
jgi:hypothetical protein